MRVLFLGNSYTHRGPAPMLTERLAARAGHAFRPYAIAPGGATLGDHLMSDEVEYAVALGGWDALVLQEQSLRPTATLGDPDAFARDAAELAVMFHDHNPAATVWLTQTWARHPDQARDLQALRLPARRQARHLQPDLPRRLRRRPNLRVHPGHRA